MTTLEPPRIVIVLDESGSMSPNAGEVLQTINSFIEKQKEETKKEGIEDPLFTLIKFNSNVNLIIDDQLLSTVKPLTSHNYTPDGMTALNDALGFILTRFATKSRVMMVVMTDGQENSSQNFTMPQIKSMIELHKAPKGDWEFIYLSADPTLRAQGESLGLASRYDAHRSLSVPFERLSVMTKNISDQVSNYRSCCSAQIFKQPASSDKTHPKTFK